MLAYLEDALVRAHPEIAAEVVDDGPDGIVEEAVLGRKIRNAAVSNAREAARRAAHPDGVGGVHGNGQHELRMETLPLAVDRDLAVLPMGDAAVVCADPE